MKQGQPLVFTYEVSFLESDIKWFSIWDAYLNINDSEIHWILILKSIITITLLASIMHVIFLRTIRIDLTRYEQFNNEGQAPAHMNKENWRHLCNPGFSVHYIGSVSSPINHLIEGMPAIAR
ncbi:hypothetical protein NE237_016106 [Protea cynaroides]|uniref:Transmembrane 9 superfamily member n=1 Tax=Protea cynaroides TaxID=273540 RepID=A0A9Q0QRP9_9MAGN|nr:hypothetical protein NE237_016106 [Protea cynaroides]